jgi:hypothetical protein
MTISVQSIIFDAQDALDDLSGVRWSAVALVQYLNDAQRACVDVRPDLASITVDHPLVPGARQAVPGNCSKLIEVSRNTNGRPVRLVKRELLDHSQPGWMQKTGSKSVQNYCYDPKDSRTFHVYPPAVAGASVDMVMVPRPTDIAAPSGSSWVTCSGNINVADEYAEALLHFVLFKAYARDSEQGNAGISAAHYQLFKSALGDEASGRAAVSPSANDVQQ